MFRFIAKNHLLVGTSAAATSFVYTSRINQADKSHQDSSRVQHFITDAVGIDVLRSIDSDDVESLPSLSSTSQVSPFPVTKSSTSEAAPNVKSRFPVVETFARKAPTVDSSSMVSIDDLSNSVKIIQSQPPTDIEVNAVFTGVRPIVREKFQKSYTADQVEFAIDFAAQVLSNAELRESALKVIMDDCRSQQQKQLPVKNSNRTLKYVPTETELQWAAIQKLYPCVYCQDVLAASVVLDCSHSFCWSCIEELKEHSHQIVGSNDSGIICVYDCPSCRQGFISSKFEPLVDRDVQERVDAFNGSEKNDYLERRERYFKHERKLLKKAAKKAREVAAAASATDAKSPEPTVEKEEENGVDYDDMMIGVVMATVIVLMRSRQ